MNETITSEELSKRSAFSRLVADLAVSIEKDMREAKSDRRSVETLAAWDTLVESNASFRLALETATRERNEAIRVLRDIATFGWYAKGAKVARAYLAAREGR